MASPENEENLEKPGGPRSAVRVMDILYKLSSASGRVSLAELSEGLELPKTSVFSLLRALDKGGYVIPMSEEEIKAAPAYDLKDLTQDDGSLGEIREKSYAYYKVKRDLH